MNERVISFLFSLSLYLCFEAKIDEKTIARAIRGDTTIFQWITVSLTGAGGRDLPTDNEWKKDPFNYLLFSSSFLFSLLEIKKTTDAHTRAWMDGTRKWLRMISSIDFPAEPLIELESLAWRENFVQLYSDYISKFLFWSLICWPGFTSDRYIFHEHWRISFGRCQSRLDWIYKKQLSRSPVRISFGDEIVLLDIVRRLHALRCQLRTVGDTMAKTVTVRATRFV